MNFHPFQGLQDLPDLPDAAHASREALVAEMLGLQAQPLPGPTPAALRVSDRDVFFAGIGCEHVALPQGAARILVVEKKGSV